jgi:hypothetical protein
MRRDGGGDDDFLDETFVWEEETVETQSAQVREAGRPPPPGHRNIASDFGRARTFFTERTAILAAAALLVLLAVVLPVVLLRGSDDEAPAPPAQTEQSPPAQTGESPPAPAAAPSTAAPAFSLPAGEVLQLGDEGADVRSLQEALVALGFLEAEPDGTFGEQTKTAVSEFQTSVDLPADGVVGAQTAEAINLALSRTQG